MISGVCVRIAVIKTRFRMVIHRANMSGIITVLLLSARRFRRGLGKNGWSCNSSILSVDALITSLAGPFCEEDTRTVMMVLAFIALVAFPFRQVRAEKRHVCDRSLAWRAWLTAASSAFAAL